MIPQFFVAIAGVIHIYIFIMESVLWGTPKVNQAFGMSPEKAAANKLRNERGQMFGALLQGRRYDEKGKQITKAAPKPAVKKATMAKPTTKKAGKK